MKCAGRNTNNTKAQSGVHKCLIQEAPFESWHAAIFSGFSVKDHVRSHHGTANDGRAIKQFLRQITRIRLHSVCRLHVSAFEGALERLAGLLKGRLLCRLLEGSILVEKADCAVGRLGELFESGRDGKRPTDEKRHGRGMSSSCRWDGERGNCRISMSFKIIAGRKVTSSSVRRPECSRSADYKTCSVHVTEIRFPITITMTTAGERSARAKAFLILVL